jgi:hypothetical protein
MGLGSLSSRLRKQYFQEPARLKDEKRDIKDGRDFKDVKKALNACGLLLVKNVASQGRPSPGVPPPVVLVEMGLG